MKRLATMTLLILALASCGARERWAAADHAECTGYGLEQGTEAYANCRLAIAQRRATLQAGILAGD